MRVVNMHDSTCLNNELYWLSLSIANAILLVQESPLVRLHSLCFSFRYSITTACSNVPNTSYWCGIYPFHYMMKSRDRAILSLFLLLQCRHPFKIDRGTISQIWGCRFHDSRECSNFYSEVIILKSMTMWNFFVFLRKNSINTEWEYTGLRN